MTPATSAEASASRPRSATRAIAAYGPIRVPVASLTASTSTSDSSAVAKPRPDRARCPLRRGPRALPGSAPARPRACRSRARRRAPTPRFAARDASQPQRSSSSSVTSPLANAATARRQHGRRGGATLGEDQRQAVQQHIARQRGSRRPGRCRGRARVSRERRTSSVSSLRAALSRSSGPSRPRFSAKATSACRRSARARRSSSSGPASAAFNSLRSRIERTRPEAGVRGRERSVGPPTAPARARPLRRDRRSRPPGATPGDRDRRRDWSLRPAPNGRSGALARARTDTPPSAPAGGRNVDAFLEGQQTVRLVERGDRDPEPLACPLQQQRIADRLGGGEEQQAAPPRSGTSAAPSCRSRPRPGGPSDRLSRRRTASIRSSSALHSSVLPSRPMCAPITDSGSERGPTPPHASIKPPRNALTWLGGGAVDHQARRRTLLRPALSPFRRATTPRRGGRSRPCPASDRSGAARRATACSSRRIPTRSIRRQDASLSRKQLRRHGARRGPRSSRGGARARLRWRSRGRCTPGSRTQPSSACVPRAWSATSRWAQASSRRSMRSPMIGHGVMAEGDDDGGREAGRLHEQLAVGVEVGGAAGQPLVDGLEPAEAPGRLGVVGGGGPEGEALGAQRVRRAPGRAGPAPRVVRSSKMTAPMSRRPASTPCSWAWSATSTVTWWCRRRRGSGRARRARPTSGRRGGLRRGSRTSSARRSCQGSSSVTAGARAHGGVGRGGGWPTRRRPG